MGLWPRPLGSAGQACTETQGNRGSRATQTTKPRVSRSPWRGGKVGLTYFLSTHLQYKLAWAGVTGMKGPGHDASPAPPCPMGAKGSRLLNWEAPNYLLGQRLLNDWAGWG